MSMELKDILEFFGVFLGGLGIGTAIILGCSSWLGKVWANRLMIKEKAKYAQELESLRNGLRQDTESYKIKLKKSEFIFEKEYEATSKFVALKRGFLPTYSHPDMDWYEACDRVAHDFNNIETALGGFLSRHSAVLSSEVKELLSCSIGIASENKFEIKGPEVPTKTNKAADELYKKLEKAEEKLLEQIHSQSST